MVRERALDRPATEHQGKQRDLLELFCGYGLIIAVIWTPRPAQRFLYVITIAYLAVILWRSFEGPEAMGLRRRNLLRSSWIVALAAMLSGLGLLLAIHAKTLHVPASAALFIRNFWGYALWSFVQQMLLVDFFLRRLLHLLPAPNSAVVAAAALFASAHLPNPILTGLTLVLGIASCTLFLRYRNLWPLAAAHAILGITLAITIPASVICNMRVGIGYLQYKSHMAATRHP